MRNTNQSEEPKKSHHQQIECNIEKCWVRMGIVTVTLLTGFTFSMAVTGVQAAAEGEGTTTQQFRAQMKRIKQKMINHQRQTVVILQYQKQVVPLLAVSRVAQSNRQELQMHQV